MCRQYVRGAVMLMTMLGMFAVILVVLWLKKISYSYSFRLSYEIK